ncbi:MAG: hypothetical protein LQ346_001990 [Caloplaca aetnensis]|nr:MAG: hypothetical protein LQ346_001990 [Caloplaca aetnensis]
MPFGITITASYAIKQSSRLLKTVEGNEKEELQDLQERLDSKIRIISPAIDMIELIYPDILLRSSARGNTSLESAVSLTKSIRWEIQALGQRLAAAATTDERARSGKLKAQEKAQHEIELKRVLQAIKKLLNKIEDAVPLINLAITASGTSLSSTLPTTVSPSRLLQASTFLTAGDTQYSIDPSQPVQIGPTFTLSMYMLFAGHIRPQYEEDVRESTWKEVMHKANVKLMRVSLDALHRLPGDKSLKTHLDGSSASLSGSPTSRLAEDECVPIKDEDQARADEYAYQLVIVEDLEDDRVHTFEDDQPQPGPFADVNLAGIREALPVHQISKIFYADTGKILNIGTEGEVNSPILLLKRDINAIPPRRMMERHGQEEIHGFGGATPNSAHHGTQANGSTDSQTQLARTDQTQSLSSNILTPRKGVELISAPNPWRIPQDLDPEWIAFEVYTETPDSDLESESDAPASKPSRSSSVEPSLATSLSRIHLTSPSPQPSSSRSLPAPSLPPIRTSLSLLETLLRLLSLQQFQQTTHLSIPDELLTFFLSESASTGAAQGDVEERKRVREEARRRVGFDPYDESPIKRRGEEYQYRDERQHAWEAQNEYDERDYTSGNGDDGRGYATPSPRYDEGYGTHNFAYPSPSSPSLRQHSPMLRNQKSKSGSPASARGMPGTPPVRWRVSEGAVKRGSPLARPGTGITDEGLGSSPGSEGRSSEAEKGENWGENVGDEKASEKT